MTGVGSDACPHFSYRRARLLLALCHDVAYGTGHDQPDNHRQRDLPRRPRPLALHTAGGAVDHEPVGLAPVLVGGKPDRQEDMFESHVRQGGVDTVHTLLVAADVETHIAFDHAVHVLACLGKAVFEFDGVGLGPETGEVLRLVGFEPRQVPGLERVGEALRQRARGQHQHVVEEPLNVAGGRVPASSPFLAGRCITLAVGAADGHVVVFTSLARIPAVGHRVVGPVRKIHAGEASLAPLFLKAVGREPPRGHPFDEPFAGGFLADLERQHSVDGNDLPVRESVLISGGSFYVKTLVYIMDLKFV